MKLTGNTILITGGASGIGYELTKQLMALGNTILITGRDQAKMDRAENGLSKNSHLSKRRFRSGSDRHSLRRGHQTISCAQHFDQQRRHHA